MLDYHVFFFFPCAGDLTENLALYHRPALPAPTWTDFKILKETNKNACGRKEWMEDNWKILKHHLVWGKGRQWPIVLFLHCCVPLGHRWQSRVCSGNVCMSHSAWAVPTLPMVYHLFCSGEIPFSRFSSCPLWVCTTLPMTFTPPPYTDLNALHLRCAPAGTWFDPCLPSE